MKLCTSKHSLYIQCIFFCSEYISCLHIIHVPRVAECGVSPGIVGSTHVPGWSYSGNKELVVYCTIVSPRKGGKETVRGREERFIEREEGGRYMQRKRQRESGGARGREVKRQREGKSERAEKGGEKSEGEKVRDT